MAIVLKQGGYRALLHETVGKSKRSGFSTWSEGKRKLFLRILHKIIKKYYIKSFATSLLIEPFENRSDVERYALGTIHSFTAINCLKKLKLYCDSIELREPITYVFESGSRFDGHLGWLVKDGMSDSDREGYRIGDFVFGPKEQPPLQAADILAYETRKEFCRRNENPVRRHKPRLSIINLHDPQRDEWFVLDEAEIVNALSKPELQAGMNTPEFIEHVNAQKPGSF
jgi:hypothetical protein